MSKHNQVDLYRKRSDGTVAIQSVNSGGFSSQDDFQQALDFYYAEGYYDSYQEAKES